MSSVTTGPWADHSPSDPIDGDEDMEARVAKLETAVEYIHRDIADVKADIKDIKKDISRLPYWLAGAGITILGVMLAMMYFYQSMMNSWLQHFLNQLPK